jgi:hypothetical protein
MVTCSSIWPVAYISGHNLWFVYIRPRLIDCELATLSLSLSPSTMSADWSAIRRRQTLAEVQNHANPSQIPQPASVLKKSAGRTSVAPGGLGPAPRSSLAPQRFFRSSSAGNIAGDAAPAASVSSSQASSQRDSLRNSRQSYAPQTSFKYHPPTGMGLTVFAVVDGRVRTQLVVPRPLVSSPRPRHTFKRTLVL